MSDEESSYDAFLDQVQERQDNITQTQASLAITEQPSLITNVTLKPHQITGISWLLSLYELENGGGGILGDDMGLGKTGQCISLFALLKERYKLDGPFLIVCPLSLIQNWMQEFERFCPSLTVSRYIGNKEERTTTQNNILTFIKQQPKDQWDDPKLPFDVLVTSYDMILADVEFLSRFYWRALVVDEAHRLKNPKTALYTTLVEHFISATQPTFKVLVTGTPVQNNMQELWSLLHFIAPSMFDDVEQFQEWFPQKLLSTDKRKTTSDMTEKLKQFHLMLKPFMLRRKKADVLSDLPQKHESILYTQLTSLQRRLYRGVLTKDKKALGGAKNRKSLTNILLNLRKCCNHPYLFDGVEPEPYEEGEHLVNSCGKMILLDKLLKKLKEEGHKVLIFSQMTSMLDILQDYMHYRKYTYERLDGSVRGEERFGAVNRFTSNEAENDTFVFLLSTRAGGVGLNLVAADTVIFIDQDFNPQMDLQAQERVHRIGQTKEVHIYRIITENTVEEVVLRRSLRKLQLSMNLIEKGDFGRNIDNENLSAKDMVELIKYGLHKVIKDDADDKDIDNTLMSMDIDEVLKQGETASFDQVMTQNQTQSDEEMTDAVMDEEDEGEITPAVDSIYVYEGHDYGKKKGKGKQSQEELTEDDEALNELLEAEEEEEILSDDDTQSQRWSRGPRRQSIEQVSEEEEEEERPQKKKQQPKPRKKVKKYANNQYHSLAIVLPDHYHEEKRDMFSMTLTSSYFDNDDPEASMSSTASFPDLDAPNQRRNIIYVSGDVSMPDADVDGRPQIVVNCISDYGVWPRGGLTNSIVNNLSDAPKRAYEEAKQNDDLHLGDAHLIPASIDEDEDDREIYVVNAITQEYDTDTNSHGGIVLEALETALTKVAYAAKGLNASVHLPRIGYGLPNVNWYGVERVIKKCLSGAGIKTLVYYFPRRGGKQRTTPSKQRFGDTSPVRSPIRSPAKQSTPSRFADLDKEDDKDVFEDMVVGLYQITDANQYIHIKRSIVANGGVVHDKLDSTVGLVVTGLGALDSTLEEFKQNNPSTPIKEVEWVNMCVKTNKLVKDPKYEILQKQINEI